MLKVFKTLSAGLFKKFHKNKLIIETDSRKKTDGKLLIGLSSTMNMAIQISF